MSLRLAKKLEQVALDSEAGTGSPNGGKALGLGMPHSSSASSGGVTNVDTSRRELPYAILECDRFYVSADALGWLSRGSASWESRGSAL
ncbi:hypothetical protein QQX98_007035 [Neonectria punicea]|uniref:Uncharacterized protein n=1 Tax=Neonectria punicea TaxID=979145 RepID=A0ABR1GZP7_9HYPO